MSHYSVSLAFVVTRDGVHSAPAPFYRLEQEYTHLDMPQLLMIERVYAETILRMVEKGEEFVTQQPAAG